MRHHSIELFFGCCKFFLKYGIPCPGNIALMLVGTILFNQLRDTQCPRRITVTKREEIINTGLAINLDSYHHVTLGRIRREIIVLYDNRV